MDIISEFYRIFDVKFRVVVLNVVLDELNVIERKFCGRDLMVVRMVKKLVERFEIVEIGCFGERFIDD